VRPGIRPCFFIQKIEAKEPEKKDAFHWRKCNKTLSESGTFVGYPFEFQIHFALNARNGFDPIK
jgi:hypothetical protein